MTAVWEVTQRGWLRNFAIWAKGEPTLSLWESDFLATVGKPYGRAPTSREAEIACQLANRLGYDTDWPVRSPAERHDDFDDGPEYSAVPAAAALMSAFGAIASSIGRQSDKDPEMSELPYRQYLLTPHWKTTKARALLRAGGMCKRCYATDRRLDVHHLSYLRLGREAESDLMVLCDKCHAAEHGKVTI